MVSYTCIHNIDHPVEMLTQVKGHAVRKDTWSLYLVTQNLSCPYKISICPLW